MAYRIETEAWDDDTKKLKEIEEVIKKEGITEDNHFDLFCKVEDVSCRSSLGATNKPPNKYYERLLYCRKLQEKILR